VSGSVLGLSQAKKYHRTSTRNELTRLSPGVSYSEETKIERLAEGNRLCKEGSRPSSDFHHSAILKTKMENREDVHTPVRSSGTRKAQCSDVGRKKVQQGTVRKRRSKVFRYTKKGGSGRRPLLKYLTRIKGKAKPETRLALLSTTRSLTGVKGPKAPTSSILLSRRNVELGELWGLSEYSTLIGKKGPISSQESWRRGKSGGRHWTGRVRCSIHKSRMRPKKKKILSVSTFRRSGRG